MFNTPLPICPFFLWHLANASLSILARQIYEAIRHGADAFLSAEYTICCIFIVIFGAVVFFLVSMGQGSWIEGAFTTGAFVLGAVTSILAGYIGMKVGLLSENNGAIFLLIRLATYIAVCDQLVGHKRWKSFYVSRVEGIRSISLKAAVRGECPLERYEAKIGELYRDCTEQYAQGSAATLRGAFGDSTTHYLVPFSMVYSWVPSLSRACYCWCVQVAVYSNVRTTIGAQRSGWAASFNVAFRAGSVMGFALTGMAVLVLYVALWGFRKYFDNDVSTEEGCAAG